AMTRSDQNARARFRRSLHRQTGPIARFNERARRPERKNMDRDDCEVVGLVEPNRVGKAVDPPTAISKTSTLWRPVVSGGFVCREPNVQHYCCISRMVVLWYMQHKRCTTTRSGEP